MTTRMKEWEWIRHGSGRVRNRKLAVTLLMAGAWMVIVACPSLASTSPTDDLIIYNDIVLYNATTNNTNNSTRPARIPNRRPRSSNYAAPYPTLSSSSGRASNNDTSNNFSSTSANSMQPTITSSPTTLRPTTLRPTTLRPTTARPTTRQPTVTPSLSPTTASPSVSPTHRPTSTPTANPTTAAPTSQSFVSYLRMTLTSMQKMDTSTVQMWQNATSNFVMDYWSKNPTSGNITVQGLFVSTRVLNQTVTASRRRRAAAAATTRFLQPGYQNKVVYQQIITYTNIATNDIFGQPDALAEQLATIPFEVLTRRNQYMTQYLQGTGNSAFDYLYLVSQVSTKPPPNAPTASPTTNNTTESFFQKYWIWFAIGGGCVAILIIITMTLCCMKKRRTSSNTGKEFHREEYLSSAGTNYIHTANYSSHPQDDSTLNEPMPRVGLISSGESIAGYGDQSVTTIDYDYTRAYGGGSVGGGQSVVSSASATLGGWTNTGTMAGGNTTVAGGNTTIFSDDASYHPYGATHNSTNNPSQPTPISAATTTTTTAPTIREELIDVICPPGKLGVVIDTPNDGPPQVHAIKDSSVVADKLRVGDRLVAVDQEDVRAMTAIKVSKMISRKSANPTRVLTILRSVEIS